MAAPVEDIADSMESLNLASKPFRFLDLPKELRLMMYELLPPGRIKHTTVQTAAESIEYSEKIVLPTIRVQSDILLTCKVVCDEARAIIHKQTMRRILDSSPKVITQVLTRMCWFHWFHLIPIVRYYADVLKRHSKKSISKSITARLTLATLKDAAGNPPIYDCIGRLSLDNDATTFSELCAFVNQAAHQIAFGTHRTSNGNPAIETMVMSASRSFIPNPALHAAFLLDLINLLPHDVDVVHQGFMNVESMEQGFTLEAFSNMDPGRAGRTGMIQWPLSILEELNEEKWAEEWLED